MSSVLDALTRTGVARQGDWSLKAWGHGPGTAWLVQVEHYVPARGGWIRAWLSTGEAPQEFPTLEAAFAAIDAFLHAPQWDRCREYVAI